MPYNAGGSNLIINSLFIISFNLPVYRVHAGLKLSCCADGKIALWRRQIAIPDFLRRPIGTSSFVPGQTCRNGGMSRSSSPYLHKQRPLTTLSDARLEVARLYHAMMRGTLDKKTFYSGIHGLKAWSALYEQDVLERNQRRIMERAGLEPAMDEPFPDEARTTH